MKIRSLKRTSGAAVVSVWPPPWSGSYKAGDKFAVEVGTLSARLGTLKSVKRLGDRLSLTIEYEGREHVGSLQWDAPPSLDNVEKVLRANYGKLIKAIGDLDVPESS